MIVYDGILEKCEGNERNANGRGSFVRVRYMKIGNNVLQGVYVNDNIFYNLAIGGNIKVNIHRWLLFSKLVMSMYLPNGETFKMGFGTFIFYLFALTLVSLIVCGVGGAIIFLATGSFAGLVLVAAVCAWNALSFIVDYAKA